MVNALDTHLRYGRGRFDRMVSQARNRKGAPETLAIEVTGGPQSGSRLFLEKETFTIGPGFDDDIFIIAGDDEVSVEVVVTPSLLGPLLALRTDRTDVTINGGPVSGAPERLPCDITIAGTSLTVAIDETGGEQNRHALLPLAGAAALVALVAALVSPLLSEGPARIAAVTPTVLTSDEDIQAPTEAARLMLEEAGLGENLNLLVEGSVVTVTGNLTAAQGLAWRRLRPRIDAQFSRMALFDRVDVAAAPNGIPAISVVVSEPRPFLLLADGARVGLGEEIVEGYALVAVDATHFHIERGDESVAVRY